MPIPRPRRLFTLLHRWVGIGAGAVVALIGLTGSTLVFRAEIDRALNPELLVVAPGAERLPVSTLVEAAAAAYPADTAWRLRMPLEPDASLEVWMNAAPDRYVYVDPYTAEVLGARRPSEFFTGWVYELHSHLLSGEPGHLVAGVAAWILVGLSISGLVAWWPGRAKLRLALTVARGRGWRRTVYDLHRAGGFYVSLLLLLSGLTGASLVFHEAFEQVLNTAFRSAAIAPPPPASSPHALQALPVDSALAAADRTAPGGYVSWVYFSAAPAQPVTVRKRLPGELHPNGKTFVYVDPRSNAVVQYVSGPDSPRGARVYSALYPLHTGMAGGTPTRILMMFGGLMPLALAVSGFLMWRARARPARRPAPGRRGDAAQPRTASRPITARSSAP